MDTKSFLQTVITSEEGYFCLAFGGNGHGWIEEFYSFPTQIDDIIARAQEIATQTNVYFSSYLFEEKRSLKQNVLRSRTIQADLDEADVSTLVIPPSVLVRTSRGRHQGYWILKDDEALDTEIHEILSKKLSYSIFKCDHSGWPLGRKVRFPNTYNYKYLEGPQRVEVVNSDLRRYASTELELLPEVTLVETTQFGEEFVDDTPNVAQLAEVFQKGPQQLLEEIKDAIPPKIYIAYNVQADDRSAALWALMCAAFRAGLSRDEVFYLAWHSANNKFRELHHHADRELAKDVVRAEVESKNTSKDVRQLIADVKKLKATKSEKNQYIFNIILSQMKGEGEFIRTNEEENWYIRRDVGRPIYISRRSEYLDSLLYMQYGINGADEEHSYIVQGLNSWTLSLPVTGTSANLSLYNGDALLVHTGRKDVLKITKDEVVRGIDGAYGVVFKWNSVVDPFNPILDTKEDWAELLFGDAVTGIIGLTQEQAKIMLKTWTLFFLFKDAATSKPILTFFGQPGCLQGEVKLKIRRTGANSSYTEDITLHELYRRFAGFRKFDESLETRIMSEKDGIITWRSIENVVFSGVKETYTVHIDGSDPFRTTIDHKFLTLLGYRKLSELSVGDYVTTTGKSIESSGRDNRKRRRVRADYHPHSWRETAGEGYSYSYIYYYKAVIEAHNNNLEIEEFLDIIRNDPEKAERLEYLSSRVVIHHKDGNLTNNSYENLEVTTKLDHDTEHGYKNQKNFGERSGMYECSTSKILSIEYYGDEPTYDITMKDESAPNFVVNNVVVHNSGKTTLWKRIYRWLYGENKEISVVSKPDDFDQAMKNNPLLVLDNVDTWSSWLPDRIATSAGKSDITKRKLYTDADDFIVRRQALLGMSAHNPKFGREDITDRLLILNFERLGYWKPEGDILRGIIKMRNHIWGGIIQDAQKVMGTPMPDYAKAPQFRVEDFARIGHWIATALGYEQEFNKAIARIRVSQKSFNLDEDYMLVSAIEKFVDKSGKAGEFVSPGQLWNYLAAYSGEKSFERAYKNATSLGKKLWALQDSLREIYDVEWELNTMGVRMWKIQEKENA